MVRWALTAPMVFWASAALTVVVLVALPLAWRKLRRRAQELSGVRDPAGTTLLPTRRSAIQTYIALCIACGSLLVAAGGLQWQGTELQPQRSALAAALLIDRSQSIEAQNTGSVVDVQHVFHPTQGRLGAIKMYLRELLLSLDRGYALLPISFAGDVTLHGVVSDYNVFLPLLHEDDETISPYRSDYRGTDIAKAMGVAMNLLQRMHRLEERVIILLSDGDLEEETMPADIVAVADYARRYGYTVFTVLVGTPGVSAAIPNRESPDGWYHRIEGDTQKVYSVADPFVLQEIARIAGGRSQFFLADSPQALHDALTTIGKEIDVIASREVLVWKDATMPAVLLALVSFVAAWWLWRRSHRENE